jgi:hypothetical protein
MRIFSLPSHFTENQCETEKTPKRHMPIWSPASSCHAICYPVSNHEFPENPRLLATGLPAVGEGVMMPAHALNMPLAPAKLRVDRSGDGVGCRNGIGLKVGAS